MRDQIFFKISFYAASQAIQMGLPVLVTPLIIRTLSLHDFGVYEAGCTLMLLVNGILTLELAQALLRIHPESEIKKRQKLLVSSVSYTVFMYTLAFGILNVFDLGLNIPKELIQPFIATGAANAVLALVMIYTRLEVTALRYVSIIFGYGILFAISHILLFMRVRNGSPVSIQEIVWLQFGLSVAGVFMGWVATKGPSFRENSFTVLSEMLRYSIPLSLAAIPVYFLGAIELWSIGVKLGVAQVGMYSASARFAAVVNLAAAGTFAAILPNIYRKQDSTEEKKALHQNLRQGFMAFEVYAIPIVVAVILFGREIIGVVLPAVPEEFTPVFGVLCVGLFIGRLVGFFPGIEVSKKTSWIFGVQLALLFFGGFAYYSVSSNGELIQIAYVGLAIQFVRLLAFVMLSHRQVGISFHWSEWIPIVAVLVFTSIFVLFSGSSPMHSVGLRFVLLVGFVGLHRVLVRWTERSLSSAVA